MGLRLYRRHFKERKKGRPEDSKNGEFEESRRGWERCDCLIHASGTLAGKFSHKSTGRWRWDEAKTVTEAWEAAGSWAPVNAQPEPEAEQPEPIPARTELSEVVGAFLKIYRDQNVKASTLAKYKTLTNQLSILCQQELPLY